ncbi:hypothetical protein EMCRGX_G004594 [Ephydatia muelleri]
MASFFEPYQFGVAFPCGAEKIAHGLRTCIEQHWSENDFGVLKVDMTNAFNLVSRQAILSECAKHFHELLPWVSWCYGQHPLLWHHLGCLTSESGVQQGDPLGPLLFSLVLNILVKKVARDSACSILPFHAWYLDDGVMAGPRSSLCRILSLLQEEGPALGIIVNLPKCEAFSRHGLDIFPLRMKNLTKPSLEILGIPIGDQEFCSSFISKKHTKAKILLSLLEEVGIVDPQVALILLRLCGAFCKLVHLARATPSTLTSKVFALINDDIRMTFCRCIGSSHHLSQAIETFNSLVSPADAVSVESLLTSSVSQKYLSGKLDDRVFNMLLNSSSVADKARLLSVSSPHAASWLSVVPSENLGLHLDPPVFQVAIKWWLGLDTSEGSQCALCPGSTLDHLGHHAVTCKYGGDVVSRHNRIRDILVETCRRAHIGVKVEVGNNLSRDHSKTRPADILLPNWFLGRTAALDVSITSPLNPVTLLEAGVSATAAAQATEARKHQANDPKCSELGWVCVPMVVETYGAWGKEATAIISSVASRLATSTCRPKSTILHEIYGILTSESAVQQGDPLGPLFFALVLHRIVSSIDADDDCLNLLYQAWYLDDGVLAGSKSSLLRALTIIENIGPSLGIFINLSKCEVFCGSDTTMFPNLDILGAPIGDYIHCAKFIASKRVKALKLLSRLQDVSVIDPQVAFTLLRVCGSFCRLAHIAQSTPPSLSSDPLQIFDIAVKECFATCSALDLTEHAWQQAQLGLRYGGLGLRSLALHACAAYNASISSSGFADVDNQHLKHAVRTFNGLVSTQDTILIGSTVDSPIPQKALSFKIDTEQFRALLDSSSPANKARLLSASASHAPLGFRWCLV